MIKKFLYLLLTIIISQSCNFNRNNREENQQAADAGRDTETYQYIPVTNKLAQELGGFDKLKDYQFFLSSDLMLTRDSNTKGNTGNGAVYSRDDDYIIKFTAGTPGVFRSHWGDGERDYIRVFFDAGDNDYLTFMNEDGNFPGKETSSFFLYTERYSSNTTFYRNTYWHCDKTPCLLLQIKKESFLHTEQASGRRL